LVIDPNSGSARADRAARGGHMCVIESGRFSTRSSSGVPLAASILRRHER
jgi:hypothetical protein